MKRAVLEWSTLAGIGLTLLMLVATIISMVSNVADVDLVFAVMTFELRFADGTLTLTDSLVNQAYLDQWSIAPPSQVRVTSDVHLPIWGCQFRWTRFSDGDVGWYLRLSMWIPLTLLAVGTCFAWRRFRAIRTQGSNPGGPAGDAA